ncbi:MAG: hypothetical protein QF785_00975 [Phycisphaeraceae bacterium]|jgi:hypothetical protein|nr:hypothetical protein [Phycisphaeraceae bacterium]MDP7347092.1 hypothetical protein [Phycisphaeraceae bacterium]
MMIASAPWELLRSVSVLVTVAVTVGVAGYIVLRVIRRRLMDPEAAEPFTLAQLREMKSQGLLTDEEFKLAKSRLIAATTQSHLPADATGPAEDASEHEDDVDLDDPPDETDPADDHGDTRW